MTYSIAARDRNPGSTGILRGEISGSPPRVISGKLDTACPVAAGPEMAKVLRTPFDIVAGRGHVPSLENREAVIRLLVPHLARSDSLR